MTQPITDWTRNLDRAISNMSGRRRILYFRSESRRIIRDAVNCSKALQARAGLSAPPTPDDTFYDSLKKERICVDFTRLYRPDGFLGTISLTKKTASGETIRFSPKLLTLSDFQVFSPDNRGRMIKQFLDCDALQGSLLLISSPKTLIPEGFSGEIELIQDEFITVRDIFLLLQTRLEEEAFDDEPDFPEDQLRAIAERFAGLTKEQVQDALDSLRGNLFASLRDGAYLDAIRKERLSEAQKDAAVRFIELPTEESVAGLGAFTKWLNERKADYANPVAALRNGAPAPKGILLCGVPGAGKTAAARETARILNAPLIQFDISRIQDSKLGESEARLRRYLDRVSAFGSCVMLMDEVEKVFGVNDSTHEVKLAMLGMLLDWMQTRKANVLTFITANHISKLPPELLRDGRINGRFFAFMPMRDDLTAILRLKLRALEKSDCFSEDFAKLLGAPGGADDPLSAIFDGIAQDARDNQTEFRVPFMTGANLESLMELTLRALRAKKSPPYSPEDYACQMRRCAASASFIPQAQSNMADLTEMWIYAQRRQYQDVSEHSVLPFSRFKDGTFRNLEVPKNAYDAFFQETFRREIETLCGKERKA